MNAWWQLFRNALTPAECESIIALGMTRPPQVATVGHGGTSRVDDHIRRSTVRWMDRADPRLQWLYDRIDNWGLQANANAFGFDLTGYHQVQFTEYDAANAGGYNWHDDNTWKHPAPFDRKMSMVIQLSPRASYEGGQLELKNDPLPPDTFTQQGDVIFFPAFNTHRVLPLTQGVRHSLVTWFVGPKFR